MHDRRDYVLKLGRREIRSWLIMAPSYFLEWEGHLYANHREFADPLP